MLFSENIFLKKNHNLAEYSKVLLLKKIQLGYVKN